MGRGGKVNSKRKFQKRVRPNDKGSDDSDEDYVVSDDENEVSDYSDEDYRSSVDGHASEESFVSFDEEEEEEEEEEGTVKRVKKIGRSKTRKRARKFIVEEEEEEEEEKDGDEDEDEEMNEVNKAARSRVQRRLSGPQKNGIKTSQKRRRVMYKEDEDDDDDEEFAPNNDEEDEDDDEFTPYDDDCSDEEESRAKRKKNNAKAGKRLLQKKGPAKGRKRRRKSVASKKPLRKKVRNTRGFRRKVRSDDDDDGVGGGGDFIDNGLVLRAKREMKRARRRYVVPSDSDFASSGSSEYEYTISEEEREQVREAREYCRRLKTNLRSSSMCNKVHEDVVLQPERKPTGRKGKEKVEEVKAEVVKQVCGICLSEEDKRKVRGTLNCCTHYFCYPCIMEWAKVESRCPLCKQRFNTISKPARNTAGIDLREMVVEVPERDQVYQPSEEELRSYIDPYENVICTECHEGGDDGLMLLCDLCDSPAHTYCVGLGREVPEGNWYCDGCRPVAIGSSSSLAQTRFSDQRTTSNSVSDRASTITNHLGEGLDLNSISSQGLGSLSSPRYHFGGFQATSPMPGAGAPTLSGRRLIHRHIQQLLSVNRMGHMADRHEGNSSANMISDLLNSPLNQGRETPRQYASAQETVVPFHAFFQERLRENPSTAVQDTDLFSPRMSQVRRQLGQDLTTASADGPSNRSLWPGLAERNSPSNFEQQLRQCNGRPNNGCDREEPDLHNAKEQLNLMIKSHLKNLSRDSNLAQNTLMDIAKSSTHTILAACELEHKSNEVVAIPMSPPPICGHIELFAGSKASLMRGRCSSCFDSFVGEVVKKILDTKLSEQWLSLGL